MASSWGPSWGTSWANSWGASSPASHPKGAFHENEAARDWRAHGAFSISDPASGAPSDLDRAWSGSEVLIYGDTAGVDGFGNPIRRHLIEVDWFASYSHLTTLYSWSVTFSSPWGSATVTGSGSTLPNSLVTVTAMQLAVAGDCTYTFAGTAIDWDLDPGTGFVNHFHFANPSDSGIYDRRLNIVDGNAGSPAISPAPAACVPCVHPDSPPTATTIVPTSWAWSLSDTLSFGYQTKTAGVWTSDTIAFRVLAPNAVTCDEIDCTDSYSALVATDSNTVSVTGDFLLQNEVLSATDYHCVCPELPGNYCDKTFYDVRTTFRSRGRDFMITPSTSDILPYVITTDTVCDCSEVDTSVSGSEVSVTDCQQNANLSKSITRGLLFITHHCDICAIGDGGGGE